MSDETLYVTDEEKLAVAVGAALSGLAEGGIPIGAALSDEDGRPLGKGRNQRVQGDNPALHGETSAFLAAGRQKSYRKTTMVTTLSACWYCSGLVRQFGIRRALGGDPVNFFGGQNWLVENGTELTTLNDPELIKVMGDFI